MKTIKVSAPGKIHLLGEHSVVYGKPALLAAIDKRCFVEITKREDKKIVLIANGIKDFEILTEKDILVKNKNVTKPFDYPTVIIQQVLGNYQKKIPSGFSLVIKNDIPIGKGLGSSAALAVAIVGAMTIFLDEAVDKNIINDIALSAERFIHGNPSGGDTSTSTFGGFVWFRKETDSLKIIQNISLEMSDETKQKFFILDTGTPHESTGEMVSLVKKIVHDNPRKAEKIFADQERLVRQLLSGLQTNDERVISESIYQGEKNLEKLGVVSPSVKKTIRTIEKEGGIAKICGGGGKTKGTGVLLGYQESHSYDSISLGDKGILFHEN